MIFLSRSLRPLKVLQAKKILLGGALIFCIFCYSLFRTRKKLALEDPPAWDSTNENVGVLRVMMYIERERQLGNVVRDAFTDRIWRQMKKELTLDLLNEFGSVELDKFLTKLMKDTSKKSSISVGKRIELLDDIYRHNNDQKLSYSLPSTSSSFFKSAAKSILEKSDANRKKVLNITTTDYNSKSSLIKVPDAMDTSSNSSNDQFFPDILSNLNILSKPIVNDFEITYNYVNSAACSVHETAYLIATPTAPGNFKRRARVRQSKRAKFANNPKNHAKLLFFTGMPNSSVEIQTKIDEEQLKYGDIVQANFIDMYKNITKKAAMMLDWSGKYCPQAKYLIRTDDDVTVNITAMISAIELQNTKHVHFIIGKRALELHPERRIHSKYSKYFISFEEWPYKFLPPFLFGGAYSCPIKTTGLLIEAMRRNNLVWLDDVFVTGICAKSLGIPVFHSKNFDFKHKSE